MIGQIASAIGEAFVKGCFIYLIGFVLTVAAAFGISYLIVDGWWFRIGSTLVITAIVFAASYHFKFKR